MSTYEARASFACASEISPVYAPPASKCACWTAKEIFLPRYSDASPRKYTAGGATTTELFFALSAALFTASNSFFASLKEAGFIFQFATTSAFAIEHDCITADFSHPSFLTPQREFVVGGYGRREGGRREGENAVVPGASDIVSGSENPGGSPSRRRPQGRYDRPEFIQC